MRWGGHNFGVVFDAQTGRQGGKAMLDWVKDWVLLPDGMIGPRQGYQVAAHISGLLDACLALPGPREGNGMPALVHGHGHRTYDAWQDDSHMAAPLIAGDALRVMHAAYRRFGFEPILMDALVARWSEEDLQDPRVCALLYVRYSDLPSPRPPMTDAQWATICHNAQAEPLMVQALAWGDLSNPFSLYTTALPFFRETQAREELAQSLDLGDVFNEPVF